MDPSVPVGIPGRLNAGQVLKSDDACGDSDVAITAFFRTEIAPERGLLISVRAGKTSVL